MATRKAVSRAFIAALVCAGLAGTAAAQGAAKPDTGFLSGKITGASGAPLVGGLVFIFSAETGPPPADSRYWRVPDDAAEIGPDGTFQAEVPVGNYYVGALKKTSGERVGPPVEGEPFYAGEDKQGNPRLHAVKKGERTDIGTQAAPPYARKRVKEGITAIEGTVVGEDGKPLQGALVFAFKSPTLIGRPLFVSDKTGGDGRFSLRVAAGGVYYLKVRDVYGGGPPAKGAVMGVYGGDTPKPVTVKTGASEKDVRITAGRFPGRGPQQE